MPLPTECSDHWAPLGPHDFTSQPCTSLGLRQHSHRPPHGNLTFCIFHSGTSRAFSATQRYRFVHGHVYILIPKAWAPQFLNFSLGDLSCLQCFSALSVCPWTCSYFKPQALGTAFLHFFTWGPLMPSVLLSAIGLSMTSSL